MKRKSIKLSEIKDFFFNTIAPIVLFGLIIGAFVGLFVWSYGWVAEFLMDKSVELYSLAAANPVYVPLVFLALVLIGIIIYHVQKYVPETRGSGVPRTEGVIRGFLTFRWLRTVVGTIVNSFLVYISGLPLGSEGPSIQLGGALGQGINSLSRPFIKRDHAWERYNVVGGASAAFATAFRAPLSGITFAVEEAVRHISPLVLLPSASGVFAATIVSRALSSLVGSSEFYFDFGELYLLPVTQYWYLLIIGVVVGLVSAGFCAVIYRVGRLTRRHTGVHSARRIIFALILTGVCGLLFTDAIGSGGHLIAKIVDMDFTWQVLLLLLLAKMVLLVFAVDSGATGGILIPMLAVGAIVGGLLGKLFIVFGMDEIYYKSIVVLSMSAFMGAVMRSPITAMVLIVETTGYLNNFLVSGIAIFIAYFVIEVLRLTPLYDKQIETLCEEERRGRERSFHIIEMDAEVGSFAVGKAVRDILWPADTVITEVKHATSHRQRDDQMYAAESYTGGDRRVHAGDTYVFRTYTYDLEAVKEGLEVLMSSKADYSIFLKLQQRFGKHKGEAQVVATSEGQDTLTDAGADGVCAGDSQVEVDSSGAAVNAEYEPEKETSEKDVSPPEGDAD